MSSARVKYYDTHTLYVTSGVAREDQLYRSLRTAIQNGEENLYNKDLTEFICNLSNVTLAEALPTSDDLAEKNKLWVDKLVELGYKPPQRKELTSCKIRVNLIVNKNGDYYGFGYIHVSREDVYWMLLGKNTDGTDRVLEYLDPNWVPPLPKAKLTDEEEQEIYSNMKWYEIAEEEDKYVHPTIRQVLKPLMVVPGYEYDEMQYRHHQEIAKKDGKDPTKVPRTGYFEFSRAYARDVEVGKMPHVLCARQVPEWIPPIAFKQIFRDYASDNTTNILMKSDSKIRLMSMSDSPSNTPENSTREDDNNDSDHDTNNDNNITDVYENSEDKQNVEEIYDTYPFVNIIDGKKDGGRIVFITFETESKDAIFALLMTRKVHIVHPRNSNLKCTLIFDHAYEKGKSVRRTNIDDKNHGNDRGDRSYRNDRNNRTNRTNRTNRNDRSDRSDRSDRDDRDDRDDLKSNISQSNSSRNNARDNTRNNARDNPRDNPRNNARDDIDISKYNYTKKK